MKHRKSRKGHACGGKIIASGSKAEIKLTGNNTEEKEVCLA